MGRGREDGFVVDVMAFEDGRRPAPARRPSRTGLAADEGVGGMMRAGKEVVGGVATAVAYKILRYFVEYN